MTTPLLQELGAVLCHQRIDRLLAPGAVLCARCTGIYLSFGILTVWMWVTSRPAARAPLHAALGGAVLLLAVVLHATLRAGPASPLERLAVGAMGGVGLAWLLALVGHAGGNGELPWSDGLRVVAAVVVSARAPWSPVGVALSVLALVAAVGLYVLLNWQLASSALRLRPLSSQIPPPAGEHRRERRSATALVTALAVGMATLEWFVVRWLKGLW